MKFAKLVALSCLVWNVIATTAHAQYPNQHHQNTFNPAPYYQWCDQVDLLLRPAIQRATMLMSPGRSQFALARQVIEQAFEQAVSQMNQPGTFRPNSYREIVRSQELLRALASNPTPIATLKQKVLATVALHRASFVLRVKTALDRPFIIPCYNGGCGGYPYQQGYGTPAGNLGQFESTLARIAGEQLSTAQSYSTLIRRASPQVIPIADGPTYFTIIGYAARWAAEDLGNLLFGHTFACGIQQLYALGTEAQMLAESFGDPAAVQIIYGKVNWLVQGLQSRPYCHSQGYQQDYGQYDQDDDDSNP